MNFFGLDLVMLVGLACADLFQNTQLTADVQLAKVERMYRTENNDEVWFIARALQKMQNLQHYVVPFIAWARSP